MEEDFKARAYWGVYGELRVCLTQKAGGQQVPQIVDRELEDLIDILKGLKEEMTSE